MWIFEAADNKERDEWVDLISKHVLDCALAAVPDRDAGAEDVDRNQTAAADEHASEIAPAPNTSVDAMAVLRVMNEQHCRKWKQRSSERVSSDERPTRAAAGVSGENHGSTSMPATPTSKMGQSTPERARPSSLPIAHSRELFEMAALPPPQTASRPVGTGYSAPFSANSLTHGLLPPARSLREKILATADALAGGSMQVSTMLTRTSPNTADPSIGSKGMLSEDGRQAQHAKKGKTRKGARVRFHDEAEGQTARNQDDSNAVSDDDVCPQHGVDRPCVDTPGLVPMSAATHIPSYLNTHQPPAEHGMPRYGPFLKDHYESISTGGVSSPFCSACPDFQQPGRQSMSLKDRLMQCDPPVSVSGEQDHRREEVVLKTDVARAHKAGMDDGQLAFWPSPPASPSHQRQQYTQATSHCTTSTPFLGVQHIKDWSECKQQFAPVLPRRLDSSPEAKSPKSQATSYSTRSCSSPNESHDQVERQAEQSDSSESPRTFSCSIASTHQRLMAAVKGTISRVNPCIRGTNTHTNSDT